MPKQDMTRRALLFGRKFQNDQEGATAIEYGLMAALIGIAIIAGARRLGVRANWRFNCATVAVRRAGRGGDTTANCKRINS